MPTKKNNYITADLQWAEEQLFTWKEYIDNNPLHLLKDRIEWKSVGKNGGMMPMVVQTIESQGKFLQDTMKNYLLLLEVIDKLREREESKKEVKGEGNVPYRMRQ